MFLFEEKHTVVFEVREVFGTLDVGSASSGVLTFADRLDLSYVADRRGDEFETLGRTG